MQLKTIARTEHDEISDAVTAAVETGNAGRARSILTEYAEHHPDEAERIRSDILGGYGVSL